MSVCLSVCMCVCLKNLGAASRGQNLTDLSEIWYTCSLGKYLGVYMFQNASFSFTENRKKSLTVQRKHFSLVPAFSCTAHKSQGQTINSVVIDLVPLKGMKRIDLSFVYVPLSRIRSDLTILRPFDFSVLTKQINSDCGDMLSDFRNRDICKDL